MTYLARRIRHLRTEAHILAAHASGEQRNRLRLAADALSDALDAEKPLRNFDTVIDDPEDDEGEWVWSDNCSPPDETYRLEHRNPPARSRAEDGPEEAVPYA